MTAQLFGSTAVTARRFALALGFAVAAAACGSSTPVTAPATTTETFTGTVQVGGADSHTFTVASFGQVDITLTAAGPPATIMMGLAVGTPSGGTCTLTTTPVSTSAGTTPQFSGTANAGSYCVQVFDIGNQLAAITYTVTVAHP